MTYLTRCAVAAAALALTCGAGASAAGQRAPDDQGRKTGTIPAARGADRAVAKETTRGMTSDPNITMTREQAVTSRASLPAPPEKRASPPR